MNDTNRIPFLDLVTPHRELEAELVGVFKTTLATAALSAARSWKASRGISRNSATPIFVWEWAAERTLYVLL